jgi:hypothetical protein
VSSLRVFTSLWNVSQPSQPYWLVIYTPDWL